MVFFEYYCAIETQSIELEVTAMKSFMNDEEECIFNGEGVEGNMKRLSVRLFGNQINSK